MRNVRKNIRNRGLGAVNGPKSPFYRSKEVLHNTSKCKTASFYDHIPPGLIILCSTMIVDAHYLR